MKKFISNISTSTANAVNSAVKQIDKTLDKTLTPEPHAAPPAALPAAQGEPKQYLRLPVDSAKKLRWYDKADVASLTRQHVREKHLLLDTITALKKVMIRAGFTDSALDEEARQLVAAAEAMRVVDHGTESVLLLAVQAEVEALTAEREAMQQEVQQLQDRLQELEAQGPTAAQFTVDGDLPQEQHSASWESVQQQRERHEQQQQQQQQQSQLPQANGDVSAGSAAGKPAEQLLSELQATYAALQAAVAAAANVQAEVRTQELLLSSADAAASQPQQQQQQQQQATAASPPSSQQQQQDAQQLQPAEPGAAAAAAAPSPDMVKRYREFALQLEERCRAAERSASLSAARVASLEESLAAAQASLAAAQQRGAQAAAQAKQQVSQLEERLRQAESAAAAASATPSTPAGSAAAAAAAAEDQLGQLQQQLAGSRMQVTNLERRLAAVEGREASLISELRSAHAAIAEKDAALAAAAGLREQLGELGRERAQLDHYKQRVAGLEAAKADQEVQLSGLAGLVATLEARLREVTAQSTAASAAAELAAATATKAQAAVAEQVAARLAAAGRNRSMWPPAAKQEVEDLERQLDSLQSALSSAREDLEATARQLQQEQHSHMELQQRLHHTEHHALQAERDAQLRIAELQSTLECCQADADGLREQVAQLEKQYRQLQHQQQQQQQAGMTRQGSTPRPSSTRWQSGTGGTGLRRGSSASMQLASAGSGSGAFLSTAGSTGIVNSPNATGGPTVVFSPTSRSAHPKWQEQNRVGGGSLYGVADAAVEAAAQQPVGAAQREAVNGVDLVYMKNVVLKFLEAVMAGKTGERDALLPAVAAVLQATPAEFAAMRKVLAATAPPGTQMRSVLGRIANLV